MILDQRTRPRLPTLTATSWSSLVSIDRIDESAGLLGQLTCGYGSPALCSVKATVAGLYTREISTSLTRFAWSIRRDAPAGTTRRRGSRQRP